MVEVASDGDRRTATSTQESWMNAGENYIGGSQVMMQSIVTGVNQAIVAGFKQMQQENQEWQRKRDEETNLWQRKRDEETNLRMKSQDQRIEQLIALLAQGPGSTTSAGQIEGSSNAPLGSLTAVAHESGMRGYSVHHRGLQGDNASRETPVSFIAQQGGGSETSLMSVQCETVQETFLSHEVNGMAQDGINSVDVQLGRRPPTVQLGRRPPTSTHLVDAQLGRRPPTAQPVQLGCNWEEWILEAPHFQHRFLWLIQMLKRGQRTNGK